MKKNKLNITNLKIQSFITSFHSDDTKTVKGGVPQPNSFNGFCDDQSCPSHRFMTAYDLGNGSCNTQGADGGCPTGGGAC